MSDTKSRNSTRSLTPSSEERRCSASFSGPMPVHAQEAPLKKLQPLMPENPLAVLTRLLAPAMTSCMTLTPPMPRCAN